MIESNLNSLVSPYYRRPVGICGLLGAYLLLAARDERGGVRSMRCDAAGGVGVVFADGRCERLVPSAARKGYPQRALAAAGRGEEGGSMALLGYALVWLWCDCFADWKTMAALCSDDARMFGAVGKEGVMAFKQKWLPSPPAGELDWPGNYAVDAIFEVDEGNRVVVAGFDCLMVGKEGRGTDVIQFSTSAGGALDGGANMLVRGVEAIRHTAIAQPET